MGIPEMKTLFGRPSHRCKDKIKLDLTDVS